MLKCLQKVIDGIYNRVKMISEKMVNLVIRFINRSSLYKREFSLSLSLGELFGISWEGRGTPI